MTLLAFQNHTWPSGGGGMTVIGYGDGDMTATSTPAVPMPAGTAEGDCSIVVIMGKGDDQTISTPAGWTSLGHLVPVVDSSTPGLFCEAFYRNSLASGETSSKTFTVGASAAVSGFSIVIRGATVGANDKIGYAQSSTARDIPTISVDSGATTVGISVTNSATATVSSPLPYDHNHLSSNTTSSSRRSAFVWLREDETGPNNSTVTVSAGFVGQGLYSIELEPV